MRAFRWKSLLDCALFLAIAAVINAIWFRHEPAFYQTTWHPYFFIIALVGLLHGLKEGLAAVVLCNLFYTAQLAMARFPASILWVSPHFERVIGFAVAGLFFGEAGEIYRRHLDEANRLVARLRKQLAQLTGERESLADSLAALKDRLLFDDAQLAELRLAADRWLSLDEGKIMDAGLDLALRLTGSDQAALYVLDHDQARFWRRAEAGRANGHNNPATISWDAKPFQKLRQNPSPLSLRDLPGAENGFRWVAAGPLMTRSGLQAVLVLERMPLSRQTLQNFRNFSYLLDLLNRSLSNAALQTPDQPVGKISLPRLARVDMFRQRIDEELGSSKRFKTPVSLVSFEIRDFNQYEKSLSPAMVENLMEQVIHTVEKHKRAMDTLSYQGQGRFLLLMPRTSAQQAAAFMDRARQDTSALHAPVENSPALDVRFGVCEAEGATADASDLLTRAHMTLDVPPLPQALN